MNIRPLPGRIGRRLEGDTPHGSYSIEVYHDHDGPVFDADGVQVGTVRMVIKAPAPPPSKVLTTEQKKLMRDRLKVCGKCEHKQSVGIATVKCAKCKACRRALSLISPSSACPLGKWPVAAS